MYPTEVIELPSKGMFYSDENPLSSGKVELKQPTAKHEDILTSKNLINKGIVIDELLKDLLVDKKIDYSTLLSIDKSALIIAARILLYGAKYTAKTKCPSCSETNNMDIDLSGLEVKEVDETPFVRGENEFEFQLPHSKETIKFKLLSVADEHKIESEIKMLKKNFNTNDSEISTRLSHMIISYGGETNRQAIKKKIINEMPTRDSLELRSHISNLFPSVDDKVLFECQACGYSDAITLPMDVNFFWPSSRK